MLFQFLLVVHALIAAALVGVILMQRSEGGGLGMGGSPSGLMSARGAADFLTRATTILATLFVAMCIGLATLASVDRTGGDIDTTLARTPGQTAPVVPLGNAAQPTPLPVAPPPTSDPLAGAAQPAQRPAQRTPQRPAARTERTAPPPASTDPVARTQPPAAPPSAPADTRLPGVISAPSIPAGNNSGGNATGPNN